MIKLKRLDEICARFKDKRILVFGDVILDRYIFGAVDRISPEAPVPVVKVEKEECRAGGAGNVAINIGKLGAGSLLIGVVGKDGYGDELLSQVRDHAIIRSMGVQTLVKTRIISGRQQIVRVDREQQIKGLTEVAGNLAGTLSNLEKGDIHGIIVSDYAKGTLNAPLMKLLSSKARELAIPLIVDPKPPNFDIYRGIDGITPNRGEAETLTRKKISTDAEAASAVKSIRGKFNTRFTVVTRGGSGITAGEKGKRTFHMPAFNHEVFDVTGAGDTVISVLTLALVCGADLREAVELANAAASIVVEKIGASQATPEELYSRVKYLSRAFKSI